MGNTLFIPIFFIVTGFMIDPFELSPHHRASDFLLALRHHRRPDCRQLDRRGSLRSCLRLRQGGAQNRVVADDSRRSRRRWRRRLVAYKTFNPAGQPLLDLPACSTRYLSWYW